MSNDPKKLIELLSKATDAFENYKKTEKESVEELYKIVNKLLKLGEKHKVANALKNIDDM